MSSLFKLILMSTLDINTAHTMENSTKIQILIK